MSNPYLGEIKLMPYNFAPRGWAFCAGQILAISTNTALFSLLGTTYGGNGQSNFGLPDLRGRVPIHRDQQGIYPQGAATATYELGAASGNFWMQPSASFQVTGLAQEDIFLKRFFDKKYGPAWHVVVGTGFSACVSYESKTFLFFYVGKLGFLLYRVG